LFFNRARQPKPPSEPWANGSASYEFVVSPVVLALLGLWLDRTVGTTPLFCVIGAVLGIVGATISIYYGYRHRMAELAEKAPWSGMPQRTTAKRPSNKSTGFMGNEKGASR
jgi:F0F1-type ATP synthase assembly protein I